MQESVYDIPGLAQRLHCGTTSAYRLVREKRIRSCRVGSLWRVTESAVMDFLRGEGGSSEERSGEPELQKAA
jgi:excisionase family DNA binding protein